MDLLSFLGGVWVPPGPAPCSVNPDQWADELYYDKKSILQSEAIAKCVFECPWMMECLRAALTEEGSKNTGQRFGIRGGTLPSDRYRTYEASIRKKRAKRRERDQLSES